MKAIIFLIFIITLLGCSSKLTVSNFDAMKVPKNGTLLYYNSDDSVTVIEKYRNYKKNGESIMIFYDSTVYQSKYKNDRLHGWVYSFDIHTQYKFKTARYKHGVKIEEITYTPKY